MTDREWVELGHAVAWVGLVVIGVVALYRIMRPPSQ